jgi:hypothetical protein
MKNHLLPKLFAAAFLLAAISCAAEPLAGTWRIVRDRSTELSPWSNLVLTIEIAGDHVRLHRHFAAGRRTYEETFSLDVAKPVNVVPMPWWPDNRHLGAYAAGDMTRKISASWLDGRRILRLSTEVTLDTQQGPRDVNILSDYKVSANGAELTLTELRSTRNRPVVYVFTRAEPKRS